MMKQSSAGECSSAPGSRFYFAFWATPHLFSYNGTTRKPILMSATQMRDKMPLEGKEGMKRELCSVTPNVGEQ